MLLPVPAMVPPQDPVYQRQMALLPRDPPFTVRVTLEDPQVLSTEEIMDVGAVLRVLTTINRDTQAVVLHIPSARR